MVNVENIQKKMEEISIILMKHENKNFCLAKVHPDNWLRVIFKQNPKESSFIIIPSPTFKRLILQREYLRVVERYPSLFGTGNDWNIVKALKQYDIFRNSYSEERFFDYIRSETMAYVFEVMNDGTITDRILRLDLCRNINRSNVFQGGILHVFKHFTPEGYDTISSNHKEYEVETFSEIYRNVILNFYSVDFEKEYQNCYVATSELSDGHHLRGVYYKEDGIPVSFINSIRIDSSMKQDTNLKIILKHGVSTNI